MAVRPTRERELGVRLLWWSAIPVWMVFALVSLVKAGQTNRPGAGLCGRARARGGAARAAGRGAKGRLVAWCLGVNVALGVLVMVGVHFPAGPTAGCADRGSAHQSRPHAHSPARHHRSAPRVEDPGGGGRSAEGPHRPGNGREPFLAATYWAIPGHLAFSCRGQPTAYAIGIPNEPSKAANDFWRPNPI